MNANPKEKHLELLQAVIARMAQNSFQLKGWSVLLASALLVFAAEQGNPWLGVIALLPLSMCWGLDGYFLAQERQFRNLYERLIDPQQTVPDYQITPDPTRAAQVLQVTFSPTLLAFHGSLLAFWLVLLLLLINWG